MKTAISFKCVVSLMALMCSMGIFAEDIPNNQIWYESHVKLEETSSSNYSGRGLHINAFNKSIVSHEFNDGKGVITFNGDLTSIGSYAFYFSTSMTSITLPNSLQSIGNCALSYCSGLSSVDIPDGVTSIGTYVFHYCSKLASVSLPNALASIGNSAFNQCTSLADIDIEMKQK